MKMRCYLKKEKIDYIKIAKERLSEAWENMEKETKRHIIRNGIIKEFENKK